MQRDDEEVTKQLVNCQIDVQLSGDFYTQVFTDMQTLDISEIDILTSKEKLKQKLKKHVNICAFDYLINLAKGHAKVDETLYTDINGMEYFNDSRFSPDQVNLLFKFRTRMYNVRNNFRHQYSQSNMLCPLCKIDNDTQEHLFNCTHIRDALQNNKKYTYNDIFTNDTNKLLNIATILKQIIKTREKLQEEMEQEAL